jgi:hypothetical protein
MAVMKWNTPPKGNAEDRRAHVVGHGDGVALQHAVSGEKVQGGAQISSLNPNYALASRWLSTAPYRGDEESAPKTPNPYGYRDSSRQGKCTANSDTCNGNATHASGLKWCAGHAKSMAKQEE